MAIVLTPSNIPELEYLLDKHKNIINGFTFPKIIHQVWYNDNPNIPDLWQESQDNWINLHPGWVYILWNRKLGKELIETYYQDFLPFYNKFPYEIQRIDAIRPAFLKKYGGLYSDLDLVPLKNIEYNLGGTCDLYLTNSGLSLNYNNCLMISIKDNPFWDLIFEGMKKSSGIFFSKHLTVIFTTGPRLFTEVLDKYTGTLCRIPQSLFDTTIDKNIKKDKPENGYLFKILKGKSWNGPDSIIFYFISHNYKILIVLFLLLVLLIIYLLCRYKKKLMDVTYYICSIGKKHSKNADIKCE